jgi:hypothetical protein
MNQANFTERALSRTKCQNGKSYLEAPDRLCRVGGWYKFRQGNATSAALKKNEIQ